MISYAHIFLPVDIAAIQQDVNAIQLQWKEHFNTRNYEGGWTVLSLRSPGGRTDEIIPDLLEENDAYIDTDLMKQCLAIKNLCDSLLCKKQSVRLMNLKKGSVIKEHVDRELYFEQGQARIHFPVFTNKHVEFYVDGERVIMDEGTCWYINANIKHKVANNGDTDRIHLVIDCEVNDWLKKVIDAADKKYEPASREIEKLSQIIPSLKIMATETSLRMAKEMEERIKELQND